MSTQPALPKKKESWTLWKTSLHAIVAAASIWLFFLVAPIVLFFIWMLLFLPV